MPRLSVIVPTWNEAGAVTGTLAPLQAARAAGVEVLVADGGSTDDTVARATPLADRVLRCARGRAVQMNAGARAARAPVLLFLHADVVLPPGAMEAVLDGLERSGRGWGRFDVRLAGRHPFLPVIAALMNARSRLSGIATGDQALFVRRDWFRALGGYVEQPLMEDIELSRRLKRRGPPLCLRERVMVSARRWERDGVARTIVLMWRLRLAYALGADPAHLAARYYPDHPQVRTPS